jgi:transcription elongation GreA/GreB family factor
MTFKSRVYETGLQTIKNRASSIEATLLDLRSALSNDSKNTAGDKHETGRAMVHLEQEQLSKQFYELNVQLSQLSSIPSHAQSDVIDLGSLIETSTGFYYLSIGLGKLRIDELDVIFISPQSPIGMQLKGRAAGQKVAFNKVVIDIISVS